MIALRGKDKGKKGRSMTPAQRAVASRLLATAKVVVGYPSRAL